MVSQQVGQYSRLKRGASASGRYRLGVLIAMATVTSLLAPVAELRAARVLVTVENQAPAGGVFITPVWVGFHNGSFDSYDGGAASAPELERLAEDGNTGPLSNVFGADGTLVATADAPAGTRQQATLGGGPIAPGASVSWKFDIAVDGANRYLSYASMVLPSNDYYIANGNPKSHDLMSLYGAPMGTKVMFDVGLPGSVNDAGTEENFANISGAGDMEDDTVAGLGILGAGYTGQSVADTGADEGGVNANVANPYSAAPSILAAHPNLDFNDNGLYPSGIASISISVVPEPSAIGLAGIGLLGILAIIRRR